MTKVTWRSWPWNMFLFLCLMIMLLLTASIAVSESALPARIIFWIMTAVLAAGAVRALLLGVSVRDNEIQIRELTRTRKIPWADVDRVGIGEQSTGLAGTFFEVQTPIVAVRSPDGDHEEVELSVLGSYRFLAFMSPGRRAAAGLTAELERWRAENGE
ncbi:hypothetical protein AB0873_07905 [Micromonospora sp. NPDC047707]|uniref:hypothetical protein n=1 Tax=Micromonospora sp. NPDC047707 TaxID=3154498 RepID=UPI0034543100